MKALLSYCHLGFVIEQMAQPELRMTAVDKKPYCASYHLQHCWRSNRGWKPDCSFEWDPELQGLSLLSL